LFGAAAAASRLAKGRCPGAPNRPNSPRSRLSDALITGSDNIENPCFDDLSSDDDYDTKHEQETCYHPQQYGDETEDVATEESIIICLESDDEGMSCS